jgi:hypothetical protein
MNYTRTMRYFGLENMWKNYTFSATDLHEEVLMLVLAKKKKFPVSPFEPTGFVYSTVIHL